MKLFALIGLLLVAGMAAAEVTLRDATGSSSLIFDRKMIDGKIEETQTWALARSSRIVSSVFTEAGVLTERTISVTRGQTTSRSDATITPHGATVTRTTRSGAGPAGTIPLVGHGSLVDPSLRWFAKDQPAKDAAANFMSFDPEFRYWEEVTVTFEGRGKIGNSPEGNLVTRRTARETIHLVLDDKGLPVVWDNGKLRLVRVSG